MKKYLLLSLIISLLCVTAVQAQDYVFSNDLSVGASGADVTALQSFLMDNGYSIPALNAGGAKGYFGQQTKIAVQKYQSDNGIPTTGYVGPMTRGKLNIHKGTTDSRSPMINGIDAPTSLSVNETGTWTVRALDSQNGTLSYNVDWGDTTGCPAGFSCVVNAGIPLAPSIQQSSTFTHAYSTSGTYAITFMVTNGRGLSTQSKVTVNVGTSSVSPLRVTYPNGGETFTKGTVQKITWTSPAYFRATNADLKLVPYVAACQPNMICPMSMMVRAPYPLAINMSINNNSYNWKVGEYQPEAQIAIYPPPPLPTVPDGQYSIQICESGTSNCDIGDKPFTVTSPTTKPKITSPNGGEVWQSNSTHPITWVLNGTSDQNAKVDLYLDPANPCYVSTPEGSPYNCSKTYLLDNNVSLATVYNWIVATDVNNAQIPAGSYRVRACAAGSTTDCDTSDGTFTITSILPVNQCPAGYSCVPKTQ